MRLIYRTAVEINNQGEYRYVLSATVYIHGRPLAFLLQLEQRFFKTLHPLCMLIIRLVQKTDTNVQGVEHAPYYKANL